jgi:hypothetical protein
MMSAYSRVISISASRARRKECALRCDRIGAQIKISEKNRACAF